MKDKLIIQVPFDGFYESSHSAQFDMDFEGNLEYLRDEYKVTIDQLDELSDLYYNEIDWNKAHEMYCEKYVSALEEVIESEGKVKIPLEFEKLESPREYNFGTDRIFAKIPTSSVEWLFDNVDKEALNKLIETRFTSYSGFASFYPNKLSEWPADVRQWDHNELGTLLEAYLCQILEVEQLNDKLLAWALMEKYICNGLIDTIIWSCASSEYKDYYNNLTENKGD